MIPENPSRSARKREDNARQDLALRLVALTEPELTCLKLNRELFDAIRFASSRPRRGSRRREMLHVGALLRQEDVVEIAQSLIDADRSSQAVVAGANPENSAPDEQAVPACSEQVSRWKEALSGNDGAVLDEILQVCPAVDLSRLRQLARNLRKKPGRRSESRLVQYLIELEAECL